MKRLLWMLAVCGTVTAIAGTAMAQTEGTIRMSWGTCDGNPPVTLKSIADGATPKLVISGTGLSSTVVGCDMSLFLGPNLPDSWRFDDAGCQTGSQLIVTRNAFDKATCPSYRGLNPSPTVFYGYDPTVQRAQLRLLDTHDNFTPTPATRYTFWQITFDHSFSTPNPTGGGLCGEVDQSICIAFGVKEFPQDETPTLLLAAGPKVRMAKENNFVSWVSDRAGCLGEVPTQPSTWGRVKGLYR